MSALKLQETDARWAAEEGRDGQKSQAAGVRPFPPELPLFQGGGVGGVVVWEAGREVVEPWRERREQRLEEMAWGESG